MASGRIPDDGASALSSTRSRPPVSRVPDSDLLDAARSCVLTTGLRRTTLSDIARTAGVSRMTLYRRYPDVRSILSSLMTRELVTAQAQAETEATGENARQRLVEHAVAVVRRLSAHELMRSLIEHDAEWIFPYLVQRLGTSQREAERTIARRIVEGHIDGSIRRGDLWPQARATLLLLQSYVFSFRAATADVPPDPLLDELRHMLESSLRPVDVAAPPRSSLGAG